jgi:hypothetical protein
VVEGIVQGVGLEVAAVVMVVVVVVVEVAGADVEANRDGPNGRRI